MDLKKTEGIDQLEYLFDQSSRGLHLLFDNDEVAEILSTPTEEIDFFNFGNLEKIQTVLGDLIAKQSLSEKEAFVQQLSQENFELVVRAYFNILENAIFDAVQELH